MLCNEKLKHYAVNGWNTLRNWLMQYITKSMRGHRPCKEGSMDRETIKPAEKVICEENMCWLCEHMDDCPINGTWINCPQNAELEAEF